MLLLWQMLARSMAHAAADPATMPKLGEANVFPFSDLTKELHHCQFWASVSPSAQANADFNMLVAPALNGAPDAISLHAASYPTHYLSVSSTSPSGDLQFVDGAAGGSAAEKAAASWQVVPALAAGAPGVLYSLRSMSTGGASGAYLSLAPNSTAPCLVGDPASFDVIADKSPADPKAATWAIGEKPPAPPARVEVDASVVTNSEVNKRWMGCHSDYGFAQTPRGFLANLIYGAAFGNRSCAWSKPGVGSCDIVPDWQQRVAVGTSATIAMSSFAAFATKPSMQINVQTPPKGPAPTLSAAIVNRGIGGMGFALEAGKPYEVEIWVWRASDAKMFAELRDFSRPSQQQESSLLQAPTSASVMLLTKYSNSCTGGAFGGMFWIAHSDLARLGIADKYCGAACGTISFGGADYPITQINPTDGKDACSKCGGCSTAFVSVAQSVPPSLRPGDNVTMSYTTKNLPPKPPPTPSPSPPDPSPPSPSPSPGPHRNRNEGVLLARHEWNVTSTGPAWGATWERFNFTLIPSAGTECVGLTPGTDPAVDCSGARAGTPHVCITCGGEIVIGMNSPGQVNIGYVSLMPGPWGRVISPSGEALPVLKSAGDVLREMGVTTMRSGGSVSQSMRWKDWRGPMWSRPSNDQICEHACCSIIPSSEEATLQRCI